jgi:hypothetical protein
MDSNQSKTVISLTWLLQSSLSGLLGNHPIESNGNYILYFPRNGVF